MDMLSVALWRSAMVLAIASSVVGTPVPASAAGEEDGQLTIEGRPAFGPVGLTTGTTDGLMAHLLDRTASTSPARAILKPRIGDAGRVPRALLLTRSQPATAQDRSWVKRHPVLFGALVGAVAGAAVVHATAGAEAAFVGFYGGAAAGGVVGLVVSR